MKAVIFDGRAYARKKEARLEKQVKELVEKGKTPYLVSILVGSEERTEFYLLLKQRAAQRVGVRLDIVKMRDDTPVEGVVNAVSGFNIVKDVHGVMVQLPLPSGFSKNDQEKIIEAIDVKRDVDGMKDESQFDAPVVRAVIDIMKKAKVIKKDKIVVVGADGFVGSKLFNKLESDGYFVKGLDIKDDVTEDIKDSDVVISATGKKGLIKGNHISKDTVVIDVGAPKGDIDTLSVSKRARFISPVPGGVGPVTIFKLLENVVIAVNR